MATNTDPTRIEELITRGVEEIIHTESLRIKLLSGRVLRVKLGVDPTSPHLHLGRSIPLLKLHDFQELGHQVVFIVGDFTGIIGDTSDKESERPMLEQADIEANMASYREQVAKLLDMDKVEFRYNSEWLGKLTYHEIGEHADQFSVADFIARENIKRRLDEGRRVSLREVLYPLLQGYDSVATHADVELGGTDQRFNLLAGRTLQDHFGQEPQDLVMNPLIRGTDGRKMSSSWGNTITLTMEPEDMYGKVMSMADAEIVPYLTNCTRVPLHRVHEIENAMQAGENPKTFKMELARELVRMYHGTDAAISAEAAFIETFEKGGVPSDVAAVRPPYDSALIESGMVTSKSELRRLLDDGGVRNAETGEKYASLPEAITEPLVLRLGKRRFVKLLP
jgi:tyrosyl-tRNA synthetase